MPKMVQNSPKLIFLDRNDSIFEFYLKSYIKMMYRMPVQAKKNLGIFFYANFIKEKDDIYEIKNFNPYFFEIIFFRLFAIFNNQKPRKYVKKTGLGRGNAP